MVPSRRDFFQKVSLATASLGLASNVTLNNAKAENSNNKKSTVSFVAGGDRRKLIRQVLEPMEEQIRNDVKGKQVIVKPNCVWHGNPLCASDVDAIRGVLDFFKPFYKNPIIIGESTASPKGTLNAFSEYRYTLLEKEYDVKLLDLNLEPYTTEWILGKNRLPLDIKIINTFLDPNNYFISLSRMKTHNCVVATLSLKNMVLASPVNVPQSHPAFVNNQFEKAKMHESPHKGINYNMFIIAHKVRPELAIIDGFVGMEGNGPASGSPVEHGVALAGFDCVSVDRIGIELMGIEYADVGYLQWCSAAGLGQGERNNIDIIGSYDNKYFRKYKLADNIEDQLGWKIKDAS